MGLSFTNIPDKEGTAVYILHNESLLDLQKLQDLQKEVQQRCSNQVILVPVRDRDGEQIRDFYDIDTEMIPAVLLVNDDDTLKNVWYKSNLPDAQLIVYELGL